jgi:hypothetical protein
VNQKGFTKESQKCCDEGDLLQENKRSDGVYNIRMPQRQEGYTRNGGGWWMDEWQPAMEKKVHVGDEDYWFSVDLSSNPNKILTMLEEKEIKLQRGEILVLVGRGLAGAEGKEFLRERGGFFEYEVSIAARRHRYENESEIKDKP